MSDKRPRKPSEPGQPCPVCLTPMVLQVESEKALIYVCPKCGTLHAAAKTKPPRRFI